MNYFHFISQAGRLLMRKLITEELCIPWNEVHLQRTPKGKPFLASNLVGINSNYNFNVSHQGDYAVLAAEPELQVGIDIMKTDLPGNSLWYELPYHYYDIIIYHYEADSALSEY